MNILLIQRNAKIGGGTTYLRAVAPELRRRGHGTHLLCGWGEMVGPLAEAVGSRVVWSPPVAALARVALARTIRAREIDLVDADMAKTACMAAPVCRRLGIPLVLHVHALTGRAELTPAVDQAQRVVVMNRSVREWTAQVDGAEDKLIHSALAVDATRFFPREAGPPEGFRMLYCGRLSRRKAALVMGLLDGFAELDRAVPGASLSVVGGRSRLRHVAQRAAEINRALGREAVRVLGPLCAPEEQYAVTDLVIGTGYVALESLACARHVIGIGVSGMVGLVRDANFQACVDANFGDHGAVERNVTAERVAEEILTAHAAWREAPRADWAPERIARDHSPGRAVDDLERAYSEAASAL